jgi:hypothetical protein
MAGDQANYQSYQGSSSVDPLLKLRDLEEKQRTMKNQVLLLGKNLIEIKEKSMKDVIDLKKDLDVIKITIERLATSVDSISEEISKFARRDDVEILAKQMKMFEPFRSKK